MTFTQIVEETFHVVSCYTCGTTFGLNAQMYRRAATDKKGSVYCPACGNSMHWTGKTETEKLQEQLMRERSCHDQTRAELEHTERRRRAMKGQLTKTKKRIAGGVCPCCDERFEDLRRHIAQEHPEYKHSPVE